MKRSSSVPRQKSSHKTTGNHETFGPPIRKSSHNSTLPRPTYPQNQRSSSLEKRREPRDAVEIEMDPILLANTPILCNKYVVGKNGGFAGTIPGKGKGIPDFFSYVCCPMSVCCSCSFVYCKGDLSIFRGMLHVPID